METEHDFDKTNPQRSRIRNKIILLLVVVIAGVWVANQLGNAAGTLLTEARKVTAIMSLINNSYVEKPDLKILAEGAIEGMLKRLDPHSVYIPAEEQEKIAERDYGEFEGVGISFVIQNELITVIAPIAGTPAERLGVHSGDKIVEIDGVNAYGITNDEVFKKLRGPKGTTVKIKVVRDGVQDPIDFMIVRDTIPIYSVWTNFMIDDRTGYALLNQFTATTTDELREALDKFVKSGMTRLIFDLRNNQGGRLAQAVSVADMFIPGGHVIVSKKGRIESEDSTYYSTNGVTYPMFDMIVLINEGSASASEIVAGAIQDLDRGLVVGSNSFGKGLVQYPYGLKDGGVIRLSTSHWYTPSGRVVQRPYDKGRGEYYAVRYRDPDEVDDKGDRQAFKTLGGRIVYASSGIDPDVKVEGGKITGGTAKLLSDRTIFEFAQKEMVPRFNKLGKDFDYMRNNFQVTDDDLKKLLDFSREKGFEYPEKLLETDADYLKTQIKAEMAQLIWSNRDYYYIIRIDSDPIVKRAREVFDQAHEIASIWR